LPGVRSDYLRGRQSRYILSACEEVVEEGGREAPPDPPPHRSARHSLGIHGSAGWQEQEMRARATGVVRRQRQAKTKSAARNVPEKLVSVTLRRCRRRSSCSPRRRGCAGWHLSTPAC